MYFDFKNYCVCTSKSAAVSTSNILFQFSKFVFFFKFNFLWLPSFVKNLQLKCVKFVSFSYNVITCYFIKFSIRAQSFTNFTRFNLIQFYSTDIPCNYALSGL